MKVTAELGKWKNLQISALTFIYHGLILKLGVGSLVRPVSNYQNDIEFFTSTGRNVLCQKEVKL